MSPMDPMVGGGMGVNYWFWFCVGPMALATFFLGGGVPQGVGALRFFSFFAAAAASNPHARPSDSLLPSGPILVDPWSSKPEKLDREPC